MAIWNETTETLPREEIEQVQIERLQSSRRRCLWSAIAPGTSPGCTTIRARAGDRAGGAAIGDWWDRSGAAAR